MASYLVLYVLTVSATLLAVSHTQAPVPCPGSNFVSNFTFPSDDVLFSFTSTSPSCNNLSICDVFVAMRPNPSDSRFLDVYMTANASGWVAVGFSNTRSMSETDVLGCNYTGLQVEAVDSWNPAGGYTPNRLDTTQNGVCLHSASFVNGRITCIVSKFSEVLDPGMDLPLNQPHFITYGKRFFPNVQNDAQGLEQHSEVPYITTNRINPFFIPSFGSPPGCYRSSCDVYVAMGTNFFNSSHLFIYMEGTAAGWIAVGFSDSRAMENTDVIGCRVNSDGTVSVVDTWNPSPNYTPNQLDDTQDGVCTHSANFINGRISCLFSKSISVVNPGQDLNLNASHYIFYGRRTTPNNLQSGLEMHTSTPTRAAEQINPVTNERSSLIPSCPSTLLGPDSLVSLIFRSPPDCSRTACDLYVSMAANTMNSDYLDIYMEGNATGWVAVGFSNTRTMGDSDVIGCVMDGSGTVSAVDSWNPSPRYTPNAVDPTQDGICLHRANFTNGRISCLVSKFSGIVDFGRDLDLNSPYYYVLYGQRMSPNAPIDSNMTAAAAGLLQHDSVPLISNETFNPMLSSFVPESYPFPRDQLLQLHGVLMIIAWPLMGIIGMFFASWMKPALPNGEWLQAHRAMLLTSLFIGGIGFSVAFIANANQSTPGFVDTSNLTSLAHFGVGVLLMVLQTINPMIAMCRCDPDHPKRWIFNTVHVYGIGLNAYILAMINIGLGTSRFSDLFQSPVVFWVFVAYVSLEMSLEIVLHVVFVITAFRSSPENRKNLLPTTFRDLYSLFHRGKAKDNTIELQEDSNEKEKAVKPSRKQPSEDSLIRWVSLGFHVAFAMLGIVMIIFISIGRTA